MTSPQKTYPNGKFYAQIPSPLHKTPKMSYCNNKITNSTHS